MADRVHAAVQRDQQAGREPPVDGATVYAEREQLPPRHDPVLVVRQRRDPSTAPFTWHTEA